MPINFPSFNNLVDRSRSDVRNQLPDTDPTIFGSFIRAITDSLASRAYDIVLLLQQAVDQFFPQTATGIFLERWAGYEGLSRIAAITSSGEAVFTGTASTAIPVNTQVTSSDGNTYTTQAAVSISTKNFSISSMVRSGTTVTVTAAGHPLATGVEVIISGADQLEYNGTFTATVLDIDSFTYEITATPSSPATGTIIGVISSAKIEVQSDDAGNDFNLDSGAALTLVTPISGIDGTAYVDNSGLTGGADEENDEALLVRVLQSRTNPVANFNPAAIEKQALTVAGVTRVFVRIITPNVGDVTIYFFRDGDTNPIPDTESIATVKSSIVELLPATSDPDNVYVLAPSIVTTNFTFSAISPDTDTMRTAITNTLTAFFEDDVEFETDVSEDKYRAAIIQTQDTQTGDFIETFTLSSPSGDISISDGQIAGLGTVTFS